MQFTPQSPQLVAKRSRLEEPRTKLHSTDKR